MIYTWHLVVATGIFGLTTVVACIKRKHSSLEAKVHRHTVSAQEREHERFKGNLQSIPQPLLGTQEAPALLHERCTIPIPNYAISDHLPKDFTRLLRHNMISFAHLPQAWIFWLVLPKHRHTFSQAYIKHLDFIKGDLICGVYRVVKASPTRVELSMEVPPRFGAVGGLLVIGLQTTEKSGVVLTTETIQWTLKGTINDLPLSKPLPKFLHEFASASLLVSGAGFLGNLHDL